MEPHHPPTHPPTHRYLLQKIQLVLVNFPPRNAVPEHRVGPDKVRPHPVMVVVRMAAPFHFAGVCIGWGRVGWLNVSEESKRHILGHYHSKKKENRSVI